MVEPTTAQSAKLLRCPVVACPEACCDGYPLCRRHWNSVGVRRRELLFRALQNYRRQPSRQNARHLEIQRTETVVAAVQEAIRAAGGRP